MQRGTRIINGFFLKPMTIEGRKQIVVMHESRLVLREDEFKNFNI
jgi:hypothetical protein